jgi:hypothetical protein
MLTNFPHLIAHADWGTAASKRVMAKAFLKSENRYAAEAPTVLAGHQGGIEDLLGQLLGEAQGGAAWVGFDFPLGLPWAYAEQAGIQNFREFLSQMSPEDLEQFCTPASTREEIVIKRPFYPARPGGTSQEHLWRRLSLSGPELLRRACDERTQTRRAACPMFWTLGPNQVGKGAISGWRDVLLPGIKNCGGNLTLWPFDGPLEDLLAPGQVVVAETYPAEGLPLVQPAYGLPRSQQAQTGAPENVPREFVEHFRPPAGRPVQGIAGSDRERIR